MKRIKTLLLALLIGVNSFAPIVADSRPIESKIVLGLCTLILGYGLYSAYKAYTKNTEKVIQPKADQKCSKCNNSIGNNIEKKFVADINGKKVCKSCFEVEFPSQLVRCSVS